MRRRRYQSRTLEASFTPASHHSEAWSWRYPQGSRCATLQSSTELAAMFVLDTNVVSELMLPHPLARVVDWVAQQPSQDMYISTISEAELRYGAEVLPPGPETLERLLAEIEGMLNEDFAGRILPFDSAAAQAYAVIATTPPRRRASNQPRRLPDSGHSPLRRSVGCDQRFRRLSGVRHRCGQSLVRLMWTGLKGCQINHCSVVILEASNL